MIRVLLCGGKGKRLWPLSVESKPKAFVRVGSYSLLQNTYNLLEKLDPHGKTFLLIPDTYLQQTQRELPSLNSEQIWTEPAAKNTAAAAVLACHYASSRTDGDTHRANSTPQDPLLGFFPVDHLYKNEDQFLEECRKGYSLAEKTNDFVFFGNKIETLSERFGYHFQNETEHYTFKEKPTLVELKQAHASQQIYQNMGIFFVKTSVFLKKIRDNLPKEYHSIDSIKQSYLQLVPLSIETALFQKLKNYSILKTNLKRLDLGNIEELANLWTKDDQNNRTTGKTHMLDSSHNFVHSTHAKIHLLGIHDLAILETPERIVILPRNQLANIEKLRDLDN